MNFLTFKSKQNPEFKTNIDFCGEEIDMDCAVDTLCEALKIQTISMEKGKMSSPRAFDEIHSLITKSFPRLHETLERLLVNEYSVLYKWEGTQPDLKPILFIAHLDVVPAGKDGWDNPPFSGLVVDGHIWGRGAIDDKSAVFSKLEAVENLVKSNHKPKRTLYFAFGHDEEIGGTQGAHAIAKHFEKTDTKILFSLDEGLTMVDNTLSPLKELTGLIGIAEKGFCTLEITAQGTCGHASLPEKETATGRLAKAITRIEKNPMPDKITEPMQKFFGFLGPEMGGLKKIIFANQIMLSKLIIMLMKKSKATGAMVQTTAAVTMMNGGAKENVLPSSATATVNFRMLPDCSTADVIEHVKTVINDPKIEVGFYRGNPGKEASKVSRTDIPEFELLNFSIKKTFGGAKTAPCIAIAGSDTKHYEHLCENSFRFRPHILSKNSLSSIHGPNEKISISNYEEMITFYRNFILGISELE